MAYPSHSGSYSTSSYDDESTYAYAFSAGPESWSYPGFDYNLQELGSQMMSTAPGSIPMYDTAPQMVSRVSVSPYHETAQSPYVPTVLQSMPHPTAMGSRDFEPSSFFSRSLATTPSLSVQVDDMTPGLDEIPPLSAATDAPSMTAISPYELRSPEQEYAHTEARLSPSGTRRSFPMHQITPLREWFEQNIGDPYPSKDTKDALAQRTGLTFKQVNHWFINARKRSLPRPSDAAVLNTPLTASPNLSTVSTRETVSYQAPFATHFSEHSPVPGAVPHFNRQPWLSPGPMTPTASYSGAHTPNSTTSMHMPTNAAPNYILSSNDYRMPYMTNPQAIPRTAPPGPIRTQSSYSVSELTSGAQRRGVRRSSRVHAVQSNTRSARRVSNTDSEQDQSDDQQSRRSSEIFQCTFPNCGKSFSSKTWKRHEETKHLPRFQWTCMCSGFIVPAPPSPQTSPNPIANPFVAQTTPAAPRTMCAFCQQRDPNPSTHPQECPHRIADCLSRPDSDRTFSRKDHLFQHLRNFHRMSPPDGSFGAQWKSRVDHQGRTWPCGFCGERLGSWERRARHLRGHFREGCRVERDWQEQRARPSHALSL